MLKEPCSVKAKTKVSGFLNFFASRNYDSGVSKPHSGHRLTPSLIEFDYP